MAVTVIVGSSRGNKATSRRRRNNTNLRVAKTLGAAVALPELDAGAFGVVIPRARTKALFLLVLAAEAELHYSGEEEEDSAQNGDSKAGRV